MTDKEVMQQALEAMRMPKVGDKVICLEDESLGEVVSLTAGGSPDIVFDDGSRGTYMLREFAELFGYVAAPQQQAEPVAWQVMVEDEAVKEFPIKDMAHDWCVRQKLSGASYAYWIRPLYATPPQRPWVGLTDKAIWQIATDCTIGGDLHADKFARAIEAKLKERNT